MSEDRYWTVDIVGHDYVTWCLIYTTYTADDAVKFYDNVETSFVHKRLCEHGPGSRWQIIKDTQLGMDSNIQPERNETFTTLKRTLTYTGPAWWIDKVLDERKVKAETAMDDQDGWIVETEMIRYF